MVRVHWATGDARWGSQVPYVTAQIDMDGGVCLPGRVMGNPDSPPRGTGSATYLDAGDGVGVLCFLPMEESP